MTPLERSVRGSEAVKNSEEKVGRKLEVFVEWKRHGLSYHTYNVYFKPPAR